MSEFPPVIIERIFKATPDRIFRAWTDPAQLIKWFKTRPETNILEVLADPRVGGSYRISIEMEGGPWIVGGTYLAVVEPSLIEFTWMWEEATMEPAETIVRVELTPTADGTHLKLTHSRLSNETSFQAHDRGWIGTLSTLATLIENQ